MTCRSACDVPRSRCRSTASATTHSAAVATLCRRRGAAAARATRRTSACSAARSAAAAAAATRPDVDAAEPDAARPRLAPSPASPLPPPPLLYSTHAPLVTGGPHHQDSSQSTDDSDATDESDDNDATDDSDDSDAVGPKPPNPPPRAPPRPRTLAPAVPMFRPCRPPRSSSCRRPDHEYESSAAHRDSFCSSRLTCTWLSCLMWCSKSVSRCGSVDESTIWQLIARRCAAERRRLASRAALGGRRMTRARVLLPLPLRPQLPATSVTLPLPPAPPLAGAPSMLGATMPSTLHVLPLAGAVPARDVALLAATPLLQRHAGGARAACGTLRYNMR
eukprot:177787-Chlamydomonas_euryale.AAC.11